MAQKDKDGSWIDPQGKAIPVKYIDPVEKRRDRMVEKLFKKALAVQKSLADLKALSLDEIHSYLQWLAGQYGEETLNPGGNYELKTFAADKQIRIKVNKVIEFDERLQLAKRKIDNCLERWSDGSNENLKLVVFEAFKVDRKGNVDTLRVLSLRKLKIKDTEWLAAMELITEAITVTGTRQYLSFHVKPDKDAEWQTIRFDLAGV